ncbi:MAG: SDR family NAD(P)-dependent oxidoreductase, partial [Bacteroidales bacterium]|nr:SDR family NAD(P)-dependent oxidoreductase [Bacteroidales bacterium]
MFQIRKKDIKNNYNNKVVIITGASSGIGKACAFEFAGQGAKVVLASRNENELKKIADEIKKLGGDTIFIKTDVRKIKDCENLIEKTVEKYNRIDVLINNAGISMRANFEDTDLS